MEHHACGTTNEDMIKRVHGGEDKQVPRTHTHTGHFTQASSGLENRTYLSL